MSFTDGLLTTLAAPRPTEVDFTHNVNTWQTRSGLLAQCNCGQFTIESMGHDESSRRAVNAAVNAHSRAVRA